MMPTGAAATSGRMIGEAQTSRSENRIADPATPPGVSAGRTISRARTAAPTSGTRIAGNLTPPSLVTIAVGTISGGRASVPTIEACRAPALTPIRTIASAEADDRWRPVFRAEERDHDARPRDPDWRGRRGESDEQLHLNLRSDDRQWRRRQSDEDIRGRDSMAEAPVRGESGREERRGEAANRPLPEPDRFEEQVDRRPPQDNRQDDRRDDRQDDRKVSFDQAVAEITARQRALDSEAAAAIKTRQRELTNLAANLDRQPDDFSGYAETDRFAAAETAPEPAFTRPQPPPILPREDVFDEPAAGAAFTSQPPPLRLREESVSAWNAGPQLENSPAPALDLSDLQQQLRQITARIEALRPASDLEAAINGLRAELAEIGRSVTEALPQRAVESLEIEIRALAQRIDHGRQSGVDAAALAGLEQGLADVREALRGLTPAESLVGFDETVRALAKKIEVVSAKDDPAALQQLETAIGALRGIVSHVASNDTLTKVAEDVRALSAKVDELAASAASGRALSALENRIDLLATALNNSTAAGYAVPRELERLLAGLIEKLELVQLSHTDHTALAHLEDRIAMLVRRLDASDARLGLLEGVERGLADLLVYIEQLRGANVGGEAVAQAKPADVEAIEHEIAEIKQTGRRTQDSLEAVHGTVEHVVGRLAMIEADMRGDKVTAAAGRAVAGERANAHVAVARSVGDACNVHCPRRCAGGTRVCRELAGRVAAAHRARLAAGSSAGAGLGRRTLAPAVVSRRADRRVGSCCGVEASCDPRSGRR